MQHATVLAVALVKHGQLHFDSLVTDGDLGNWLTRAGRKNDTTIDFRFYAVVIF